MATADFLKRADALGRRPVLLASITFPTLGLVRFASRPYTDPNGNFYNGPLASFPRLDAGGSFLASDWNPVDCDVGIVDKHLDIQVLGRTASRVLWDDTPIGSKVVVEQSFMDLTVQADIATIFEGEVAEVLEIGPLSFVLHCVQNRKWILPSPPRKANRTLFTALPDELAGTPLPIVFGDMSTERGYMKYLAAEPAAYYGAARAPFPALVIDPAVGASSGNPKFLLSDRGMHTINDDRIHIFEPSLGRLAEAQTAGTVSNPAGGPATVQLANRQFRIAVIASLKHADTTATASEGLLNETPGVAWPATANLDFDLNKKILRLTLPDVSSLGTFVSGHVRIGFNRNNAHAGSGGKLGWKNSAGTLANTVFTSWNTGSASFPDGQPTESLEFAVPTSGGGAVLSDWSQIKNSSLYVELDTAVEKMHVYGLTLVVVYEPSARIVRPGIRIGSREDAFRVPITGDVLLRRQKPVFSPEITEFETPGFGFGKGIKDDASGTYTGTANALIEHPADLIHWLARNMGNLTASEVETASGAFGSFLTARTDLSAYKVAGVISSDEMVDDTISRVSSECLLWVFRRTTVAGAKLVAVAWKKAAAADYRSASDVFVFERDRHFVRQGSFRAGLTPISQVRNVVRVNFQRDLRTRAFKEQVYVTDTDSRGWTGTGYARDQNAADPDDREVDSATSIASYGRKELTVNLQHVSDPATATDIRDRLFDMRSVPRVRVRFDTFMNAADLERGHVIRTGSTWNALMPFPKPGSTGSWAFRLFRVVRTSRRQTGVASYSVEAVEA